MKPESLARHGRLRRVARWYAALRPARPAGAVVDRESCPITFDAVEVESMVWAVGTPCSVLHHNDGAVTIAAGSPDEHRAYPILCRLGSTTGIHSADFSIHPGHSLDDYTPQNILIVAARRTATSRISSSPTLPTSLRVHPEHLGNYWATTVWSISLRRHRPWLLPGWYGPFIFGRSLHDRNRCGWTGTPTVSALARPSVPL